MKLLECTRCSLHETRTQVVPGRGAPRHGVVFVGEAPGQDEDTTGRPFVGRAGAVLKMMIEQLPVPEAELYITNVVKCRPVAVGARHQNRTPTVKNRAPSEGELTSCARWLDLEIAKIRPWLIVALGSIALVRLMGAGKIGEARGRLHWCPQYKCLIFAMYHPSYILRQGNKATDAMALWIEDRKKLTKALKWKPEERHALALAFQGRISVDDIE